MKYETTGGTWGCAADAGAAGTGDSITVNSTAATDANFLDTAAQGPPPQPLLPLGRSILAHLLTTLP